MLVALTRSAKLCERVLSEMRSFVGETGLVIVCVDDAATGQRLGDHDDVDVVLEWQDGLIEMIEPDLVV